MATPDEVEPCEFEEIFELAADAKGDGIRAKNRDGAQWYRYENAGMCCLWEPGNRASTKRISHWWVRDERRGEGIGRALFERAVGDAEQSNAATLDIYVYDDGLVTEHGFEERPESSQAMDDARYFVKDISK